MSQFSTELDCAKSILSTYQAVHDTPQIANKGPQPQSKLHQKNKELEIELNSLKEKYKTLQNELSNREERLARLNRQLIDRTSHVTRLQEDYENVIDQLSHKLETK